MRVLLAGEWRWQQYQGACGKALTELGVDVIPFSWERYFRRLPGRVERRLMINGDDTRLLGHDLVHAATKHRPDVVWVWGGTHIRRDTLAQIRLETGARLVSYNNDDPFGPVPAVPLRWLRPNIWRWFKAAIREYDLNFVFRRANIEEYRDSGAKHVEVLPPYFIPELHRPIRLAGDDLDRYRCDLVFVGHYEDDGRAEYLRALVLRGYHVRVFGNGWPAGVVQKIFGCATKVSQAIGEDYVKALCGARLCLSFLSKLNRDTYTRRSFEIPACGRVMVSERTDDLESFFRDGQEAVYFSSIKELLAVASDLLADEKKRVAIGAAARDRSLSSGFDVESRMSQWLTAVSAELRGDRTHGGLGGYAC